MLTEVIDYTYYNKLGVVLILPLIFIFLMCMIDFTRTKLLFSSLGSNQYFYRYPFDSISGISMYHFFGFCFTSILYGLLLMLFLYENTYIYQYFFTAFLSSWALAVGYLLGKLLVSEFLYSASNKKTYHKQMLTMNISYLSSFCVLIYIPIYYIFLHLNTFKVGVKYLFISCIIFYLFKFILLVNNNKKLLSNKMLYIILYLCTLEIVPFIYLFKCYIE